MLKSKDITLLTKVHIVKRWFSSSHVWREWDHKEGWVPKNACFWMVILEKTLESLLDSKEIQPVHPKGNQSWIFIGRTDIEAESPILWPPDVKNWLIGKDPNAGKVWRQEEKRTTEDDLVGWHHWFNGRVWINSGSWWWTWRPDMLHSMGSQRVGHDWGTELNRTAFFPLLPSSFSVVFISTLPQHSYFASFECQSPSSQFLMLNSFQ